MLLSVGTLCPLKNVYGYRPVATSTSTVACICKCCLICLPIAVPILLSVVGHLWTCTCTCTYMYVGSVTVCCFEF